MDKHPAGNLELENFSKQDTYTDEEKKFIMDRLNEERLIHQRAQEAASDQKKSYTEEEKKNILQKLNEKRLSTQKREEIKKKRLYKKEIYKFGNKDFYKFKNMEREYFIEVEDCNKITTRPCMISLYYKSISEYEVKKKDVLMKTEIYSDKFFVSHDPIRVYYKQYALENEK